MKRDEIMKELVAKYNESCRKESKKELTRLEAFIDSKNVSAKKKQHIMQTIDEMITIGYL
jgi:ribonuclease HII